MANLVVNKTYDDGEILSEQNLDDAFQSIEAFINITKIGTDNIQNNSIGTTQLKDSAVTAAKLGVDAVATINIQDSAVATAKIADGAVTTSKLAAGAITPGPGSITNTMLAASNLSISTSSGNFGVTSTTGSPSISATITTVGRPFEVGLLPVAGGLGLIRVVGTIANIDATYSLIVSGIGTVATVGSVDPLPGTAVTKQYATGAGSLRAILSGFAAGTYTVTASVTAVAGTTAYISDCLVFIREL